MAHFAIDKTLTANNLRFHYRDWNGHGWPTLLIHALSSTSHSWDLVAPLLTESSRTIALDLRGHGRSDKPDSPYSLTEITSDILSILESLQMERTVLVGHGWGAEVALHVAAHTPDDHIAGLVMVDGGLVEVGTSMSWLEAQRHFAPTPLVGVTVDDYRQQIIERTPQEIITPAVEAALLASFEIGSDNHLRHRLPDAYHQRIVRTMWEMRLAPLYEKLTCPVLILPIRGSDDFTTAKEKGAAEAERLIADLEMIWFESANPDVTLHRPHYIADEVRRFIKDRL